MPSGFASGEAYLRQLINGCLLTVSSHVFPLGVCTEREGILASPPLLMRMPYLLD